MISLIGYAEFFLASALIFSVLALGLNVQWGMTGLFNAGIAGFMAIGAYTSALLTTPPTIDRFGGYGLPIVVGCVMAVIVSGVMAALIGKVTLRLREDYLAITTFGIAIVVQLLLTNLQPLTGGPFGISFIPRTFEFLGKSPALFAFCNLLMMVLIVAVLYVALETLARSPWGRVLRSIREDQAAAASLGKDVKGYELQAFVVGSMVMGLAGALQAHFIGFISPDYYLPLLTFQVWAMLMVGGAGNNKGAILGSIAVWALWSFSGYLIAHILPDDLQTRGAAVRPVLIGIALVIILMWRPSGLLVARAGKTKPPKGNSATGKSETLTER